MASVIQRIQQGAFHAGLPAGPTCPGSGGDDNMKCSRPFDNFISKAISEDAADNAIVDEVEMAFISFAVMRG